MLKSLTSFRFIAAFMVYLTHSVSIFNNYYNTGHVGVSFFFVLSGFILVYNYHSKFTVLNSGNIKKFYMARLAKIYPVYLLTLSLSIPYMFLINTKPNVVDFFIGFIVNILMIQSFIPLPFGTTVYSFNYVSWSLSDELFFYILFPFIVYLLVKLKIHAKVYKNLLVTIIFFIGVICVTIISSIFHEAKMNDWYFYVFPVFRLLDFIMGILIGMIFVAISKKNITVNKSLFNLLELFSLILFIGWIACSPYISQAFSFSIYYVPVCCLLIYIFAFQGGIVSKWLSNKWLVFLGEISFSFYMVHLLVINYIGLFPVVGLLNHLITLTVSILLSALIYVMFEEPMRKKIRYGLQKNKQLHYNDPAYKIKI